MATEAGRYLLIFAHSMTAPIKYPEKYKPLESLDIMLQSATEYIPRKFQKTRPRLLTWVGAFLYALSEGLTVREACERSGVAYASVFAERDHNPEFKAAWEEAARCGTDVLAGIARERALEKSDLLMMFLLKARQPETYNEKYQAQKNATIAIQINHHYPASDHRPTSIEVHNRAEVTDSEESTGGPDDSIDVTPQKD